MAQEVRGVLRALQRCFPEYQGFQGCPVAPVGPGDQEDQGGPEQAFFSLEREKAKWLKNKAS